MVNYSLIGAAVVAAFAVGWWFTHGTIKINYTPGYQATFFVDDKRYTSSDGSASFETPRLWIGSHTIAVEHYGYERFDSVVSVGWGRTTELNVELKRKVGFKANKSPSLVMTPHSTPPSKWAISSDKLVNSNNDPLNADIARLIAALESVQGEGEPVTRSEFMDMVSRAESQIVYPDEIMKYATPLSLAIQKKEHENYTKIFMREHYLRAGVEFLQTQREYLEKAEREYGVLQRDVVSTLIWESGLGKYTGDYKIFNVFLGQILFLDEAQQQAIQNLIAQGKPNPMDDPVRAEKERVRLEKRKTSAITNIAALLRVCKKEGIDPLEMKGSWGGAIGSVQFMPANLKYAVDGDGDGKINLSQWPDAIMSVGNFLKTVGNYQSNDSGRRNALLKYNPSKEYASGVMLVAETVWKRYLTAQ